MNNVILYADQYVEIYNDHVDVIYDRHTERYDLAEIKAAKLVAERFGEDRLTRFDLLALGVVSTLALVLHLHRNLRWTLTIETTSGPVDILTSPDGLYLSKVKREINKVIRTRARTPQSA